MNSYDCQLAACHLIDMIRDNKFWGDDLPEISSEEELIKVLSKAWPNLPNLVKNKAGSLPRLLSLLAKDAFIVNKNPDTLECRVLRRELECLNLWNKFSWMCGKAKKK